MQAKKIKIIIDDNTGMFSNHNTITTGEIY